MNGSGAVERSGSAFLHPDGYAMYRVFGDDPMIVRVGEFIAATTDAGIALCRALLGLDLMEKVVFGTHPADPLPYLLTDHRVARLTYYEDDLWLRIMDIPTALEARSYQSELSTVLEVSDGFRSDGGRFALEIREGRARCYADGRRRRHSDGPRRAGQPVPGCAQSVVICQCKPIAR